jgi:hypothetical protein
LAPSLTNKKMLWYLRDGVETLQKCSHSKKGIGQKKSKQKSSFPFTFLSITFLAWIVLQLSQRIRIEHQIQHCFICRPKDSTVSEDAGIEPMTFLYTSTLAVRHSIHSARSHNPIDFVVKKFCAYMSAFCKRDCQTCTCLRIKSCKHQGLTTAKLLISAHPNVVHYIDNDAAIEA